MNTARSRATWRNDARIQEDPWLLLTIPGPTAARGSASPIEADVDEFADTLERFERGEIGPDAWRAFRLVRGTYGQRQAEDAQMLRVKIPQGVLTAPQLEALADVADRYSRGFGHITTRQNVQFHFMKLHDVEPAMRLMADAGLTTREACGSAVRNITGVPARRRRRRRGVRRHAVRRGADPPPAAASAQLEAAAQVQDRLRGLPRGSHADRRSTTSASAPRSARTATRGFRVTVAGGTSIMPRAGALLHAFLPAGEIFDVADAILRVYAALGDYQHKQRNRLKFLIKTLGWERWYDGVPDRPGRGARRAGPELPLRSRRPAGRGGPGLDPAPAPTAAEITRAQNAAAVCEAPVSIPSPIEAGPGGFDRWMRTNVHPQKQDGFAAAVATIPLGDVTAAQLRIFADLASAYGDGTLRITTDQNAVFRWVRVERLAEFYGALTAAGFGLANAGTIADVVSCPGAESCRLAVTQSRGLGRLLGDHLRARTRMPRKRSARRTSRSAAARTAAACITSRRSASRAASARSAARVVPQYFVMAGGGADADGASFGRIVAKIPARRCPEAVDRLVALYRGERQDDESLAAFMRRADTARLKAALSDLEAITEDDRRADGLHRPGRRQGVRARSSGRRVQRVIT